MATEKDKTIERLELWKRKPLKAGAPTGDRVLRLLLELKFSIADHFNKRRQKKAERIFSEFVQDAALLEIKKDAADAWAEILTASFNESCGVFARSCKEDESYGRRFFQLIKMKPDDVAAKAGSEIYGLLIRLLLTFSPSMERDALICALDQSYRSVFVELAVSADSYLEAADAEAFRLLLPSPQRARP